MNLKSVKSQPTEPQISQQTAQYLNSSVVKTSILLEGSCVLGMEITPELFLAVLHCCPTGLVTTHTDICGCQSSGTLQPTAGRHRGIVCLFPNVNVSILWKKACRLSLSLSHSLGDKRLEIISPAAPSNHLAEGLRVG